LAQQQRQQQRYYVAGSSSAIMLLLLSSRVGDKRSPTAERLQQSSGSARGSALPVAKPFRVEDLVRSDFRQPSTAPAEQQQQRQQQCCYCCCR
jgi:hypothetical protein